MSELLQFSQLHRLLSELTTLPWMDFRCTGDLQVRHEGGLHPGIAELPLQIRAWILHGHLLQRNIGSSHR